MRVTMIGAGYVGLVSGACFADFGHQVICIDKDATKVAALNRGEIPIFEPGLAELVEANMRQGRLRIRRRYIAHRRRRGGVHRRRHAVAPRRRPCRSELRLCGGARDRATSVDYRGRRHQIDRAGRHRRRDRAYPARAASRCRAASRVQSGILARRRRDPGFQASRPHRHRHRRRRRPRRAGRNLPAALPQCAAAPLCQPGAPPS